MQRPVPGGCVAQHLPKLCVCESVRERGERELKRIPKSVRDKLKERAQDCCEKCGKWGANNAHHRKNQSQGHMHTLSNLLLLCGSGCSGCHGWVTQHPEKSQQKGWSVHPYGLAPKDAPVWRFDLAVGERVRVLLSDDGSICPAGGVVYERDPE